VPYLENFGYLIPILINMCAEDMPFRAVGKAKGTNISAYTAGCTIPAVNTEHKIQALESVLLQARSASKGVP